MNLDRLTPITLLYTEAALSLAVCLFAYSICCSHHWLLFACLFFVPDVALLLYLWTKGASASALYNLFHSYTLPLIAGLLAIYLQSDVGVRVSLIWVSHISFDRMVGYGLKYATSFKSTHMQTVGVPPPPTALPR